MNVTLNMADDFDDVEDMLEAPFRKDGGMEVRNRRRFILCCK